jgi:hypothetical protein
MSGLWLSRCLILHEEGANDKRNIVFFSLVISVFPFRPMLIICGISSLSASFLLFLEIVLASWHVLISALSYRYLGTAKIGAGWFPRDNISLNI